MYYEIYYETDFPEIKETDRAFVKFNENLGYSYSNDEFYLAEGTYYLKLDTDNEGFEGDYNLSFNTIALEEFSEPNDVIAQATDISVGDSYRGIISSKHSGGDFDFFKIYSPEDKSYIVTIDCSKSVGDIAFSIFDGEGENIGAIKTEYGYSTKEYIHEGERKIFEAKLPAGNSYLRLYGYTLAGYNQSGEYTISVSDAGGTGTDSGKNNGNDSSHDNSGDSDNTDYKDTYTDGDIHKMVKSMRLVVFAEKTKKII